MSTFLDQAEIFVKAGKGGDGMVAFRREKYVPDGGPAGGDGGQGGDVIFKVDEGLHTLLDFRYNRHFKADNGENGMSKSMYGRGADDLYVRVPAGTLIRDANTNQLIADLTEEGQEVIVAKGGRGGRGNKRFATQNNPAPSIAENGEPGEERDLKLELRLLADVALVGYPSVGKSTLLSVISNAKPKIADYQFTTLSPNLGMVQLDHDRQFVVADMPGLIEGAAEGVGLGHDFLRHIERTNVILHVIDMAGMHGRDPFSDFEVIMEELSSYNERILLRPMLIVANKMDEAAARENIEEFREQVQAYYKERDLPVAEIIEVSAYQTSGIDTLLNKTYELVKTVEYIPLEEEKEESFVHITLPEAEEDFYIRRLDTHLFEIYGDKIERLYAMTNTAHEESLQRFARQMRGMGIDEALREAGAQDGDIIQLADFQFEFVD